MALAMFMVQIQKLLTKIENENISRKQNYRTLQCFFLKNFFSSFSYFLLTIQTLFGRSISHCADNGFIFDKTYSSLVSMHTQMIFPNIAHACTLY